VELISSIPLFGGFLWTLLSFVVVLSVIVFIHEFGHYIVGRWCGIHAEVFSLGFGPKVTSWHDKRGTRWQLSAFPFGGYVKFLGDADASSRTDQAALEKMDEATRARSFHGARLYKKALTVAAGPVANFILSIAIFSGLVMVSGLATDAPIVGQLKPLPAAGYTLKPGDRILAINGVKTPDYPALYAYARTKGPLTAVQDYTVRRAGQELTAKGPFPLLPLVDTVQPQSAAMAAGLKVGDLIESVDGKKIIAFRQLQALVSASAGRKMHLKIWRDGNERQITLAARVVDMPDASGKFVKRTLIGITGGLFFRPKTVTPGPLEAVKIGALQTYDIVSSSLGGLVQMVRGSISACNLQGPVGIAKTSGDAASQGVSSFVWFIAVLSTAIGLLNLFPIPVLDGGHLVFFGYEAIAGKPPSDRVLQVLMSGGLFLIIALMVFALTNDFFC